MHKVEGQELMNNRAVINHLIINRSLFVAFLLGICSSVVHGYPHLQAAPVTPDTSSPKGPHFEVASVRLVPEKDRGLTSISGPDEPEFRAHNITLEALTGYAFGVDSGRQIVNEPSWMSAEEYDIAAKVENNQKLGYEELKPLVQHLLQERFHLEYHRETRMHKGFALVIGKNGPRLHVSKGDAYHAYILSNGISAADVSLETLAALLTRPMGDPVVDRTGIAGKFDIQLKYDQNATSDSGLPSLTTALQDELGLKLVRQDVSEEVIVIDRVDKVPTEN